MGRPHAGPGVRRPPIPGPEVFDTRKQNLVALADSAPANRYADKGSSIPGSNNWALSGKQTADGRAFVANDMHLGIRVPHIWYRASFVWHDGPKDKARTPNDGRLASRRTPVMVVGSNGHVAWGFTNSQADWVDDVLIDVDPHDKDSYLTPKGPQKFEHHAETIKVKNEPDVTLDVVSTIWGPVIDHDSKDRPRAGAGWRTIPRG